MPSLQLHQLRVAAVAKLVCGNTSLEVDQNVVLLECLFHDMGNIVKSDFDYFPDFLEPEGREYWEDVKREYIAKYGPEQHAANAAIAREIGLPSKVIEIMDTSGFGKVQEVLEHGSTELKICQYADMRVGPHGILPLRERLAEGRERYKKRKQSDPAAGIFTRTEADFEMLASTAQKLEDMLFSNLTIVPEDVTDQSVAPVLEKLWDYAVT